MLRRARRARSIHRTARRRGYRPSLRLCWRICAAANDERIHDYQLAALVEQESAFRFVFGHDVGGPFPGRKVTRSLYRQLVAHVRRGGTYNGVGYVQATWGPELVEHPGLWKPKANLRWGAAFQKGLGLDEAGLNRYNGDPSGGYGRARVAINDAYRKGLS
jgi:hypothetical protein